MRTYVDGYVGAEEQTTIVPRPIFPFKQAIYPDTFTRQYERQYRVKTNGFVSLMGQRTSWSNLLSYSEDFTNGAWTKTAVTATADQADAPDGQETMGKILETSGTSVHEVTQGATVAAVPYEFSIFVRGGLTRRFLRLAFVDSAAATHSAMFDFTAGIANAPTAGVTARVVNLGNGDFRLVLRVTPAAGAGTFKASLSTDGVVISYTGNTSSGAYVWGAQVTAGVDTPYISTTGPRSISAPIRDPFDPFAFLVREGEIQPSNSEWQNVPRIYSRIPKQQIVPSDQFITKPSLSGDFPQVIGDQLVTQPDPSVGTFLFFSRKAVTSDSGPPGVINYPTGGTYTITIAGDTTAAIAFNASAATVQAAINALPIAAARGNFTVSGLYNSASGFQVSSPTYGAGTLNVGSLTATNSVITGASATQVLGGVQIFFQATAWPNTSDQITGGTFTVTVFGQTTSALAYNCSTADLLAALQALPAVGPTATIEINANKTKPLGPDSGPSTNKTINFTLTIPYPAHSVTGSLTPAGSSVSANAGNISFQVTFTGVAAQTRTIGAPSHGLSNTDAPYVTSTGGTFNLLPGQFSVFDGNTIVFTPASGSVFYGGQISVVGKLESSYVGGGALVQTRVQLVTDFFLIGVSPGITTIEDIPLPLFEGDDASLLAAIIAGSPSINYEVGKLESWEGTPILARTVTKLNASQL